jgi:AcrR family transcriptional regulator
LRVAHSCGVRKFFATVDVVTGLRERKKQATREALSWAAVRLTVERGWDGVLVEDIAAAAGVSPRTFNNYFSSKAEAIAFRHHNRFVLLADELRARPAGEPLWDAIRAAALAVIDPTESQAPDGWTAGVRMMTAHPAMVAEVARATIDGEQLLAEVIAERTGTADPVYPRLVAAAFTATTRIVTEEWVRQDHPGPIGPMVLAALDRYAAGLPEPTG